VTDGWFDYRSYTRFLADNAAGIAAFRARQAAAFEAEKERWLVSGEFDRADPEPAMPAGTVAVPERATPVQAPFIASVWQVAVRPGSRVAKGGKLVSLEAMKMETILTAPHDGTVAGVYVTPGAQVMAGQVLVAVLPDEDGR
jgi:urea carboxylase